MNAPWLPALRRQRISMNGHTIGYGVVGQGAPVVLVHGLSGSARWWQHNIAALAEQMQVFVVDLVGFGDSRGSRFVLGEAADVLIGWMDAVGLPVASLVGHSMGGYIVTDIAANHPERVNRLLLVDAAVMPFERNYPQHALGLLHELLHLQPAFLPVLVQDAMRAGPWTLWGAMREIIRADLREKLPGIVAPTLIVWGALDDVVPVALGRALHAAIPASELVVLARAGHNAMWDQPHEFNRLAVRFLRG